MSLAYIRRCYGVPAKRGARVRLMDHGPREQVGTIASARGQYLRVRVDGSRRPLLIHPTWMVQYEVASVWMDAADCRAAA